MRLALLVTHGAALRNFAQGQFLREACAAGPVHVVHSFGNGPAEEYGATYRAEVHWHSMPRHHEGALPYILRRTFLLAHMRACGTRGMRLMLSKSRPRGLSGLQMANRVAWWLSMLCGRHRPVQFLVSMYNRLVARSKTTKDCIDLWRQISPDVVFSSDQRPPDVVPAILAARHLGIPVGTFIFSWDNLSSKGRMPTDFDFYLVWSDLMRGELLRFYPHVAPSSVLVTGTPQFDVYADRSLLCDREAFCKSVGADPRRPIICYAGEDIPTVPDAPAHLALLCELVRRGAIRHQPQILVRPCPVDDGIRYHGVLQAYPEVIWCPPRWYRPAGGGWQSVLPSVDDTRLLVNTVHHSALCVNVTSTMTLDFAILDKPAVNIAFDVSEPPPHGRPVWDVLFQFEHYRPVVELGAARIARSPQDLARHINGYLENPSLDSESRKRLVELEVGVPIGQSSRRLVETLCGIAARRQCTSASSAMSTQV